MRSGQPVRASGRTLAMRTRGERRGDSNAFAFSSGVVFAFIAGGERGDFNSELDPVITL